MKFDFCCQGHVIFLIVRMSRLHTQILGARRGDESNVIRLSPLIPSNFLFVKVLYSYLQII